MKSLWLAQFMGLIAMSSSALYGSPIFVSNFSFETLPAPVNLHAGCGAGCQFTVASENAIPGWTASSPADAGQFAPGSSSGTTTSYNSVPDGTWVAYANAGNLSQVVTTVAANTIYSLTVSLGLRKDLPIAGAAELLINGVAYTATGTAPTAGNWSTFTATYSSGLHPADVGLPITIELLSSGTQAGFDNVALNAATVPEPAGVGLVLTGLIGLALATRGRKRQTR
jgi:hypothetical protein